MNKIMYLVNALLAGFLTWVLFQVYTFMGLESATIYSVFIFLYGIFWLRSNQTGPSSTGSEQDD